MDQSNIYKTSYRTTSLQNISKAFYPLWVSIMATLLPLSIAISVVLGSIFMMTSAQAASCKVPKSYYKNVSCTADSNYFLAKKDFGAPVALIDKKGKKVADLMDYQRVDGAKIAGGLMPVQRNSRVGYVNMQGRLVIPTMYDILKDDQGWARPVSEGRIVVKRNGHYGVINTSNQTIVPFSSAITNIDNYRGGIAKVRKNQALSWLDKNGKTTSDPNAKAETKAPVQASDNRVNPSIPLPFTTLQPHQQDGKWGFVDEKKVTMITYSFDDVRPFSEGLAGVRVDDNWGFVNLGGDLVIPFRYDNKITKAHDNYNGVSAFVFNNGKAWVGNLNNGDKMCIDKQGETVSCD